MKSDVKRDIEKELKRYALKEIRIQEKKYPLYLVPELCDEDLNIFEGFLFVEAENKSEVSYLKTKYRPPVSGYTPRIGIILYDGHLLIKDYRRNKHIIKTIRKINKHSLINLKKLSVNRKKRILISSLTEPMLLKNSTFFTKRQENICSKTFLAFPKKRRERSLLIIS